MIKNTLTIGLNDKDAEYQIIDTATAKKIIAELLINKYNIFAFTMIDCAGVYKMSSTGRIIQEVSIRIEIITDDDLESIDRIIENLKSILNQESIMHEISTSDVYFK